jgi:Bifunctional DNA primase/polymerase, N-terminal
MNEVAKIACNLARNTEWCVFSCLESKAPATPHGFKDATNDPGGVAKLWLRHPGPLIGVATGQISGVSVLDIDLKSDDARAWWRQNEHRLPATQTYRTRSGGLHLYYKHAPGVKCSAGKPTPGVDARGDGGYVVFWFASGLECLDHTPSAPWPGWLTTYFWPPVKQLAPANRRPVRSDGAEAVDGILRVMATAREHSRNNILYWSAHRLRDRFAAGEISRSYARQLLTDAANAAGLPEIEIARTIASAWRA